MSERVSDEYPGRDGPWSGEAAAGRLLALVRDSCAAETDLPGRLAAAIRATLDFLAADPDLARLLTVDPYLGSDEEAFDAQRRWTGRFGTLLREAVADDQRTATSDVSFLSDFLIDGVRLQIARLLLRDEASGLPRLLPSLLEVLLAYYFEPGEPRRLTRAALDG